LSGIRPWEETMRRVHGGWRRHELRLTTPGWHFAETHQQWVGPCQ